MEASTQDYLDPDTGILGGGYAEYKLKVRELFCDGFKKDVLLRIVFIESFEREGLVGIRRTHEGLEVFELRAAIPIWNTELIRYFDSGMVTTPYPRAKEDMLQEYQRLKRETPADFREIPVEVFRTPIDQETAERVSEIWKTMLLAIRHPEQKRLGIDADDFYFSMSTRQHGDLSGHVMSPNPESKAGRLVSLAYSMRECVRGEILMVDLRAAVSDAAAYLIDGSKR